MFPSSLLPFHFHLLNLYVQAPFQNVYNSQSWKSIGENNEWSHKVFLVWPQGLYMKLGRGCHAEGVQQLMPADMQVYGYTCETCAKPEEDDTSKRNQCVVQ